MGLVHIRRLPDLVFFFFNDTATTEIYTLSYTTLFRSSKSSSVSLPQRVFASPLICFHFPSTWSQFMSASFCVQVKDRKSTRLNSSHLVISYAVFCLKKKSEIFDAILSITTIGNV